MDILVPTLPEVRPAPAGVLAHAAARARRADSHYAYKAADPSHVKFILWVDVLYRATSRVASVDYLYGHTAGNACQQTLGFWEYLDRTVGDADYSDWTEAAIGERYVQYQSEPTAGAGNLVADLSRRI